jgi:hypothetical protein
MTSEEKIINYKGGLVKLAQTLGKRQSDVQRTVTRCHTLLVTTRIAPYRTTNRNPTPLVTQRSYRIL